MVTYRFMPLSWLPRICKGRPGAEQPIVPSWQVRKALEEYADREAADSYAGYYRHPEGKGIVVGFTSGGERHARALRRAIPVHLEYFEAVYSKRQLHELHDRLLAECEQLKEQGVELQTLTIDYPINALAVGVADLDDTKRQYLFERYRDAVRPFEQRVTLAT